MTRLYLTIAKNGKIPVYVIDNSTGKQYTFDWTGQETENGDNYEMEYYSEVKTVSGAVGVFCVTNSENNHCRVWCQTFQNGSNVPTGDYIPKKTVSFIDVE